MKYFLIIALFCITFVGLHAEGTKAPYHFGGAFNDIDVEGNYAYVASDVGLKIFDVSDPSDLRLIGTYDTNVSVQKLVVDSDRVYLGMDNGIEIVDIHSPTKPQSLGLYSSSLYNTQKLEIKDSFLYRQTSGGVSQLDVHDVSNISEHFLVGESLLGLYGNYAFIQTYAKSNNIKAVDTSDPSLPSYDLVLDTNNSFHIEKGIVAGHILYVYGREGYSDPGKINIYDITDPLSPQKVATYVSQQVAYPSELFLFGQKLFLKSYGFTIEIVDVSDPSNPMYASIQQMDREYYDLKGLSFHNDTLFVVTKKELASINIADLNSFEHLDTYRTLTSVDKIILHNNELYVSDSSWGLVKLDVSNPNDIKYLENISISIRDMKIRENNIYVLGDYLTVIDVSNPKGMEKVYQQKPGNEKMIVTDNILYTVGYFGLKIYDLSIAVSPDLIKGVTFYNSNGDAYNIAELAYKDKWMYAISSTDYSSMHLLVFNLSDPKNPELVKSYELIDQYNKLTLHNDTLYLYSGDNNKFQMVDVSEPASPLMLETYSENNINGSVSDMVIHGYYAYLLSPYNTSIEVVDITQSRSPLFTRVKNIDIACNGKDVALDDKYLYIADKRGITVLPLDDTDNDGIADAIDDDIDGDGVANTSDAFPRDANESLDTDYDGIGNNADDDDDNDGVTDSHDLFPLDPSEYADTDGDGVGDNADVDDDNDGIKDINDTFPNDPHEWADTDHDGIGDNADADDDNDGIDDQAEIAAGLDPHDPRDAHKDSDGDGFDNAIELSVSTDMRDIHDTPIWVGLTMADGIVITIPAKQGQ